MDLRERPQSDFRRHPWEIVRASFFCRVLREHLDGQGLSAVDIGAGDAFFASRVLALVPAVERLTCFDPAYDQSWTARAEHPAGLVFTATRPSGTCDVVLMLDVLEHADDDRAMLRDAIEGLRPGGLVALSVPAYPPLFSRHDVALGHKRRYFPRDLRRLVHDAGLVTVMAGQLFAGLVLPRMVAKLCEPKVNGPLPEPPAHVDTALGTWNHGRFVTRAMTAALALDAKLGRVAARLRWPWPGLSTWVVARKP